MNRALNLKFFIVDDDPFCRMLYNQHLVNLGYKNNILLENGIDCINKLDLSPDVIFLDYDMHPINGLEVLQRVKQLNPDIHLLIISQQRDNQVVLDAFKYGAYDYIVKGDHDLEMIRNVVDKIVSRREISMMAEELVS